MTSVCVQGLPKGTTKTELLELFSPFGNIIGSRLHQPNYKKTCDAFVLYETSYDAEAAVAQMKHKDTGLLVRIFKNSAPAKSL